MAMKKQPHGARRAPRGERATGPDGKKLPPDQYDIAYGDEVIGYTERARNDNGITVGWRAYPAGGGAWPLVFEDHTKAVDHLITVHKGRQLTSETGTAEEQAETEAILADPGTMAAIAEGMTEADQADADQAQHGDPAPAFTPPPVDFLSPSFDSTPPPATPPAPPSAREVPFLPPVPVPAARSGLTEQDAAYWAPVEGA